MLTYSEFLALVDQYHNDSLFLSHHNTGHSAIKEIVSHGKDVIPFIVKELHKQDSWLPIVLLSMIVGIPNNLHIHNDMAGNFDEVSEAWIKWASENGYDKYMVLF